MLCRFQMSPVKNETMEDLRDLSRQVSNTGKNILPQNMLVLDDEYERGEMLEVRASKAKGIFIGC